MGLDLRWPIGIMFFLIGLILAVVGLATGSDTAMYQRSLGHNINLGWGLFLAVFGIAMMGMAWHDGKSNKK